MSEENIKVITDKKTLYDKCENMEQLYDKYYLPLLCRHYDKTYLLQSKLQEKEKIIITMEKYFELICNLGFDCDGCNTKESLKNLIDELVHYSNLGRVANTTEEIYMTKDKSFNILHEEILERK